MKKIYIYLSIVILSGCHALVGPQGEKGDQGMSGQNCTVTQVSNGATILCPDGSNVLILNGENSPPTAYTIIEIINPCGKQGSLDQVLFRMANRELITYFVNGKKQFLTILSPGNYKTTDGFNCNFTINNNLDVIY